MTAMPRPPQLLVSLFLALAATASHGSDLPQVPPGFEARVFAKDPLVRNPCALAFDARGRVFIGQGTQYRMPQPQTPPDSVLIVSDTNGDGVADQTKVFATGFNCIQSLAWNGRDLWIANAPDLTVVRDLDGDDEADEYVRVFTDLGNLEHALHGLIWGPDGKLYMAKGNSKGLTVPGRIAPKPFRDLWAVSAPPGTPDFPPPQTYKKGEYQHLYQDPADDWGREGGVLRCDDLGKNLEIVSRGLRNPFDLAFDSAFNWLTTDNDHSEGDRIVMPFHGAHFGWGHAWSAHWTGERHPPTVPVSGPLFPGSGTGVLFYDAPQFPPEWRGVWLFNDWQRKTTFAYRPRWDGALLQPQGGKWEEFAVGGDAFYRPVEMEIGPDGTLWVLGWGKDYNRPQKFLRNLLGQTQNIEGRVFQIAWKSGPRIAWRSAKRERPAAQWSVAELADDLGSHVPAWSVNAQAELLRRGAVVKDELARRLAAPELPLTKQTWLLWTLGRLETDANDPAMPRVGSHELEARLQWLRILAQRSRRSGQPLPAGVVAALQDAEPRVRFEAVQAIWQARQQQHLAAVTNLAATETDRITYFAAWGTLRDLGTPEKLEATLTDVRPAVRRAALLALADLGRLTPERATALVSDPATADVAALWLAKRKGSAFVVVEPPPGEFENEVSVSSDGVIKPSTVRYTLDGTTPTVKSPKASETLVLRDTATITFGLFVDDRLVGEPFEAVYRKRSAAAGATVSSKLEPRAVPTTVPAAMALLDRGHPERGRALFFAEGGAGCANCHRFGAEGHAFGPDLSELAQRGDPESIVRSILEPNADVTEGFALQQVSLRAGGHRVGVLREETGYDLTLAQPGGQTVRVLKEEMSVRESLKVSAMPAFDHVLAPQQVADLAALLTGRPIPPELPVRAATPWWLPGAGAVLAMAGGLTLYGRIRGSQRRKTGGLRR